MTAMAGFKLYGRTITDSASLKTCLDKRRSSPGYLPPAADLGYCLCGTIWNIEALADQNFKRSMCPECGEDAIVIERGRPSDG